MLGRWIAVSLIVAFLALVGVIAGAVLWRETTSSGDREALPQLGAGTERLEGTAGPWSVKAELTRGAANELIVVLAVANTRGGPAGSEAEIAATLKMLDMAMVEEPISLTSEQAGRWRGVGRLSMDGRWMLTAVVNGDSVEFPFTTAAP